ncbi:MAG: hypothetical protein GY742_19070 [Hyphomicrobiales bacterium]|nr:hypothetical protein [Hyphomicrobiales bacterium]
MTITETGETGDSETSASDEKITDNSDDDNIENAKIVEIIPAEKDTGDDQQADKAEIPDKAEAKSEPEDEQPTTTVFPLKRRPDDPGVDTDIEADEGNKGYRVH